MKKIPNVDSYIFQMEFKPSDKNLSKDYKTREDLKDLIGLFKKIKKPSYIKIEIDNDEIIDVVQNKLNKYIINNFKGVKNAKLWKEYIRNSYMHRVIATKYKGKKYEGDRYTKVK